MVLAKEALNAKRFALQQLNLEAREQDAHVDENEYHTEIHACYLYIYIHTYYPNYDHYIFEIY